MNFRLSNPDKLVRLKRVARRKGLTVSEFARQIVEASIEAEELAEAHPGFLESLQKFLAQFISKR